MIDFEFIKPFVPHVHFQMEGLHCLKTSLRKGDYMTSTDLKNTFFRSNSQILSKVSSFHLGHKTLHLSGSPFNIRIFTKFLKPVAAFLRKQGYRIIIYLDDFLLLFSSKAEALRLTQMSLSLLQSVGFLINWTKSTLSPV